MAESHGRAWQAAYAGIVPVDVLEGMTVDPSPEEVEEWYEHYVPDQDRVLVADLDGRVRGYAYFRWDDTKEFVGPEEAGLKEIYVHPDHWGDGIGTALLERGLNLLPEDATALKLEVLAANDRGRGFYEARGFKRVGTSETQIGDQALEAAIYALDL